MFSLSDVFSNLVIQVCQDYPVLPSHACRLETSLPFPCSWCMSIFFIYNLIMLIKFETVLPFFLQISFSLLPHLFFGNPNYMYSKLLKFLLQVLYKIFVFFLCFNQSSFYHYILNLTNIFFFDIYFVHDLTQEIFILYIEVLISKHAIWSFYIFLCLFETCEILLYSIISFNVFSANSNIFKSHVSYFIDHSILLPFIPSNLLSNSRCWELYLVGCLIFLYSYKYS